MKFDLYKFSREIKTQILSNLWCKSSFSGVGHLLAVKLNVHAKNCKIWISGSIMDSEENNPTKIKVVKQGNRVEVSGCGI